MMRITDAELIQAMAHDESKAFEGLYLRYGRKLLEFVSHYMPLKDDAEEIVQSVFIKLWNKRKELKHNESVKGYIFTIAYNEVRKAFVKKKRDSELLQSYLKEFGEDALTADDGIDYHELVRQVDCIVESMPEKRRAIYQLCKKEGLTVAEVAKYLNISEKTVKNQMTAAYSYIREQMKGSLAVILFLSLFH